MNTQQPQQQQQQQAEQSNNRRHSKTVNTCHSNGNVCVRVCECECDLSRGNRHATGAAVKVQFSPTHCITILCPQPLLHTHTFTHTLSLYISLSLPPHNHIPCWWSAGSNSIIWTTIWQFHIKHLHISHKRTHTHTYLYMYMCYMSLVTAPLSVGGLVISFGFSWWQCIENWTSTTQLPDLD